MTDVLAEDEKLLLRFHNTINKQVTRDDINNYIRQVDLIADRYLGRNHFISYYERMVLYQNWKKLLMKMYAK